MDIKKKRAAAIAGVALYLKSEQEAAAMQAAGHMPSALRVAPPIKMWGLSGRQSQMQMRNMMQMKTFK